MRRSASIACHVKARETKKMSAHPYPDKQGQNGGRRRAVDTRLLCKLVEESSGGKKQTIHHASAPLDVVPRSE